MHVIELETTTGIPPKDLQELAAGLTSHAIKTLGEHPSRAASRNSWTIRPIEPNML